MKPRRRQARGERRIAQLLDAASRVFCTVGYTAATTNAIAREAGVSPGTLYQFFPNKEALAIELSDRLIDQMHTAHGQAFDMARSEMSLQETVDAILDPLIEFNCRHPVLFTLINSSGIPGRLSEEHDLLHASLMDRTKDLIARLCPALSAAERVRTTAMSFALFKAGLELVLAHEGAEQQAYIGELKAAVRRYIAPLVDPQPAEDRPDRRVHSG